jgi:AP-3 complex subunit mu
VPPLLVIEFLHKIADTFVIYFGDPADESAVKDNFSTAYQLLEEMVDHGWPLTTEPNALTDLIRPPTVLAKVSTRRIRVDHSCRVILCASKSK